MMITDMDNEREGEREQEIIFLLVYRQQYNHI